jgi:hypothetical protein
MTTAKFELAIPAIKRLQTYALNRMTTGIGQKVVYQDYIHVSAKHYFIHNHHQNVTSKSCVNCFKFLSTSSIHISHFLRTDLQIAAQFSVCI